MKRSRRHNCRNCGQLYEPDPRSRWHQKYCSQAACQKVSKTVSHRRWRHSSKGRDYFKGSANVLRVQAWRKSHPGYSRKKPTALQDILSPQTITTQGNKPDLNRDALQDFSSPQGFALLGLVAKLTGLSLQEDIASTTRSLISLGQEYYGLNNGGRSDASGKTGYMSSAVAQSAAAVQLDRPSVGAG